MAFCYQDILLLETGRSAGSSSKMSWSPTSYAGRSQSPD